MFSKTTITKVSIISVAVLLVITGCAKKTPGLNSAPVDPTSSQAPEVALNFNSLLDLGNGINLTISSPEAFTPTVYASNYVKGQVANRFKVVIANAGTSELDLSQFIITSSSNGVSCVDVLDGENGITGAPTDPLASEADVTFNYGIACNTKIGTEFKLSITTGSTLIALNGVLQ